MACLSIDVLASKAEHSLLIATEQPSFAGPRGWWQITSGLPTILLEHIQTPPGIVINFFSGALTTVALTGIAIGGGKIRTPRTDGL